MFQVVFHTIIGLDETENGQVLTARLSGLRVNDDVCASRGSFQ